jgi:hypothetical protein
MNLDEKYMKFEEGWHLTTVRAMYPRVNKMISAKKIKK